jgi:hypothetical protein
MKGIVFAEFMHLTEERFGLETCDLAFGGSYASVGAYPHREMLSMVVRLSELSLLPVDLLLNALGHYLFQTFYRNYPIFFKGIKHPFDLLEQIDNPIHVEVKKLYPDAKLPRFETTKEGYGLVMIYRSLRKMANLAISLIEAAAVHYDADIKIETAMLKEDGSEVNFKIT